MKLYETMKRKIINIFKIKSYFASSIIEMCRKHANRHCCIDNLRFSTRDYIMSRACLCRLVEN